MILLKEISLIYLIVSTTSLIFKSNLIDFNDRKMQFHNVPYYETYWHRVLGIYKQKRHRINYKIEVSIVS